MTPFKILTEYSPDGEQTQALEKLNRIIIEGNKS